MALKVWCVLPSAVLYMTLYARASATLSKVITFLSDCNINEVQCETNPASATLSQPALFRACVLPFMAYFLLFGPTPWLPPATPWSP